ncbi:MAG: ribosomal protection-like ABC-F family protein [Chlamydiota bacterium]
MQVNDLSKSYGAKLLFSQASFQLGDHQRCAIVGRNGCGKTTLLKIIAGEEEPDSGEVCFPKGSRVGVLPQHLRFEKPTILEEGVLGLRSEVADEHYRVEKILSGLGFTEKNFSQPPDSFSGGYQLRLALCKVLVGEPEVLLLDEPTNYLDIVSIRWLERYLRSWKGQVLFISHDRAFINNVCTHILGFQRGQLWKVEGDLEKYYQTTSLWEETYQRTLEKQERKKNHMLTFVERFGSKSTKASQAQSRLKAIEKMDDLEGLKDEKSLAFDFRYHFLPGKQLLRAEGLTFAYEAQRQLIKQLSFEVEKGDRVAIIGKNGRGKSTVLRLLVEQLSPQGGKVTYSPNTSIGYFGQSDIEALDSSKTIEEELESFVPQASYEQIRQACGAMMFSGDDAKKKIAVLSGGERSRVLLAKIFLKPVNLLILDEPTHHLDLESIQALMLAVERFPGAVLIVSHDEHVLRQLKLDKLIVCRESLQECFHGDYESFLEKQGWEEQQKPSVANKTSKDQRHRRAERVRERAAALRPIKKAIADTEREIIKSEEHKQQLEEAMMGGEDMQVLIKEHGQLAIKLEEHYLQLQELYEQEDEINRCYSGEE